MITWNPHEEFSVEFLAKYHDLVLYDIFHHIKAHLLFPPNCSCSGACRCPEWRRKIVLSLNTDFYNKACRAKKDADILFAMKRLWGIENYFSREQYVKAYPIWLIERELKEREEGKQFQMVDRLIWGILRLAVTHKATIFRKFQASMREVIALIIRKNPLETKESKQENYLGGEKAYFDSFNKYKPLCHLIAAQAFVKRNHSVSSLTTPGQIETFLKTAHWLKKELLRIERPNTKQNIMFAEETFLALPSWVNSDDIKIPIEPFQDKLQEIDDFVQKELQRQRK